MAISAALGALIGYSSNWLAAKSLFRLLEPRWYSLGRQGVIPSNRRNLAGNISKVVGTELLTKEFLSEQVRNKLLQDSLDHLISDQINRTLSPSLASWIFKMASPMAR